MPWSPSKPSCARATQFPVEDGSTISEVVPSGQSGSAAITFTQSSDGTYSVAPMRSHGGNPAATTGTWLTSGAAGDYDVRFTFAVLSGATSSTNTASTGASADASHTASVTVGPYGSSAGSHDANATLLIEFRRKSDSVVISSTTIYYVIQVDGSV